MIKFAIDFKNLSLDHIQWPDKPLERVAVIGHGALAERQKPTYVHWVNQDIAVHCADVDRTQLDDCINGIQKYVIPNDEDKLLCVPHFDLLCINNVPDLHLMTALHYGTYADRIIIQKPQDLNYPLIQRIATASGFERFRRKTVIHDHYRNKSVYAALLTQIPELLQRYGKFKRIMFFLTESKSVSDEPQRAQSLNCGMIQDLAVHLIDLMLELLISASEWSFNPGDDRLNRRIGGDVEMINCVKRVDQTSILGDEVETFAAMDLQVTEKIEFPAGSTNPTHYQHRFNVLVAVGKGLAVEQGAVRDLKSIVIEFEREGFYVVVDLATLNARHLSIDDINHLHGGMNRPLMLISPNPPEHALRGAGGTNFRLWQSLSLGQHVAAIASCAKEWEQPNGMPAYPYQRPLGDLIRELASKNQIRQTVWGDLPPLTSF